MDFNRAIINESRDQDQAHGRILVLDASFVPKWQKDLWPGSLWLPVTENGLLRIVIIIDMRAHPMTGILRGWLF